MSGNSKKTSEHQKKLYKSYRDLNKREANKVVKLSRHLQAFPDDYQAKKSLENILSGKPCIKPKRQWRTVVRKDGSTYRAKLGD